MSWNLQKEIKEILATEIGTQIFAPGRRTPVAFLYPNTYHLGMSNLGLHILYQILNRDGWACERVFLPEERKREEYAKPKTALFSMETQRPLADFPYICATLSFEMDYLNFDNEGNQTASWKKVKKVDTYEEGAEYRIKYTCYYKYCSKYKGKMSRTVKIVAGEQ